MPFEETVYGPMISGVEDLVAAIQGADRIGEQYESARLDFIARYMELEDGHASARLVDRVFASRGDA